MTVEEYAKKEQRRESTLPWVKSGENAMMTDTELREEMQRKLLIEKVRANSSGES